MEKKHHFDYCNRDFLIERGYHFTETKLIPTINKFKKFTLLDESITTIATDHTIPNNMEKKQSEMNATEDKTLIGLVLNVIEPLCEERGKAKWTGKRSKSVILNEIVSAIEAYNLDRESSPVTWDVEAAAKKCIDALYTVNQYEAFVYGAQWQANRQSTTIERLTKALDELSEAIGTKSYMHLQQIAREALNSIKK